jgi:hypothetical protein
VRVEVKKKLDESSLEAAFGNIETFFSLFPDDEAIKDSSIELVVSMLNGVENAIGFFISKQSKLSISSLLWVFFNTKLKSRKLSELRLRYGKGMDTKRISLKASTRWMKTAES